MSTLEISNICLYTFEQSNRQQNNQEDITASFQNFLHWLSAKYIIFKTFHTNQVEKQKNNHDFAFLIAIGPNYLFPLCFMPNFYNLNKK
jgi:hypothetical protein